MTPTARSMALMKKRGYQVFRVEYWNSFARKRYDLIGCDLLVLKEGEPPTLIQVTTAEHRNARINKLNGLQSALLWVRIGGKILVHGWRPLTQSRRRYEVEEIEWEGLIDASQLST